MGDHAYRNLFMITSGGFYIIIDNFQFNDHKIGKYDYLLNSLTQGGNLNANFPAATTTRTSSNYILYGFGDDANKFYVYDHTDLS